MLLEHRTKLKIKQLIEAKKAKKSHLSVTIGYNKGFISTVLGDSKKFFNLEHIEKICAALNYPIHLLFMEEAYPQDELPAGQIAQGKAKYQTDPPELSQLKAQLERVYYTGDAVTKGKLQILLAALDPGEIAEGETKKVNAA